MESFWIFIWKILKKVLFIKSLAFWNKRKKQTFRKFVFTCYTWNIVNTNWRMKYFVWYCLNTIVRKFNNSNIGRVNAVQNKFFYLHKMGQQIKSSLLLTLFQQFYSHFNFNFLTIKLSVSNWEKTIWTHISLFSTCFCYYRNYPNNDNKICQLPYFSCFQHHFHDWFYVLRYNSDLSKLEWILLLLNFNYIVDLTNRHKFFLKHLKLHLFL